jgi:hypothetical protein
MIEKEKLLSAVGLAVGVWGLWQLSRFSFNVITKEKYGKKVGWRCEYPECGIKLDMNTGEFHHEVPEAEARRRGWPQRIIDSDDNCGFYCLPHHLVRHEELGDKGGAAWIRERIKRREIGYANQKSLLRKDKRKERTV